MCSICTAIECMLLSGWYIFRFERNSVRFFEVTSNQYFNPSSGVDTYDSVRLSAAPKAMHEACILSDGLALVVQPRMETVQEIYAPPQPVDVAIWMLESVSLDEPPSDDLPTRDLLEQSMLILPKSMPTRWIARKGMPEVIHLHISADFRSRWCDDAGIKNTELLPASNMRERQFGAYVKQARRALAERDPFRRLRVQVAALEAARICLAGTLGCASHARSCGMTPARMRRVRSYVEDNLTQEICLEDMAGCVGLSPSHFSRAFRAETGLSPYAWVVQARVERVKHQLLNSRKSLAEIALDCGFASQSHMTQTFSRTVGIPPARWRREVRQ